MKRLGARITDLVTVFMKVMVKRRMRGSTRSQSERSTFKKVCRVYSSEKYLHGRHCHDAGSVTTGKVSPQEPTLDKRLGAATTAAEHKRSPKDPFLKHI